MRTPSATAPDSGPPWRAATASESAILAAAVNGSWEGASELRSQLPGLLARSGCTWGCGTIELRPQHGMPASGVPSPVPSEGIVLDSSGEVAGGLLVFLRNGLLLSLEVYSHGDPLPMPDPDRVRWETPER